MKDWQKEYVPGRRKEAAASSRRSYHKHHRKSLKRMARYRKTAAFKASVAKSNFIHREKKLAATRAWRKTPRGRLLVAECNNRRRGREANQVRSNYPPELVKRWNWLGGRCAYCREETANTYDHFIPLGEIGEDVPWNLVPSCRRCNCSKGAKDPFVWFNAQPFYSPSQIVRILRNLEDFRKIYSEALS